MGLIDHFNPGRLTLARQRRGLTKVALAVAVELAPRTLSQYERGAQVPRESTLNKIATSLDYPGSYFSLSDPDGPALEGISFRAMSRMSARTKGQALSFAATAVDLSNWILKRFSTPLPNVPQFADLPPNLAAESLRREWGLGEAPLPHTIDLMEKHGVRVFSLPLELDDVDANSFWRDSQPFVMISRSKSAERSRFDIAHELGHLTLHRTAPADRKKAEQEANEFASTFMMPATDVSAHAPQNPTLSHLIGLKRRWGVSLAALTHRLHKLQLLSDWQYRAHFIDISRRGFRKHEPNGLLQERSQVLDEIIRLSADSGVTLGDIATDLCIPTNDLQALVFGFEVLSGASVDSEAPDSNSKSNLRLVY